MSQGINEMSGSQPHTYSLMEVEHSLKVAEIETAASMMIYLSHQFVQREITYVKDAQTNILGEPTQLKKRVNKPDFVNF